MPRKDLRGKRKRTRITSEILEKMVDLRKRGFIYKEIAEKLGIAIQTVAKHIQKEGLGGWRKKVTGEVMERMRELKGEGLSYEKIAGRLGLSVTTVCSHLKKEEKVGPIEEKEEKVEEKVGFVGKLKRRLGLK